MYYRSQSFKLVFLFFLVLLFFVNQVNPQLVGPYDGDVPLTDTIEKYVETLKDEFSKSEFVSTYLYPKVLYQDSKITISRQVDIYNYERVTTHIGGYTRKLNITYYKVYFIVKNNHKLPLQVTFSTGKFSKYWYFLEVDNVSKNAAEQTYTWSLYILPNEEKRVAFGTPYYMDSELTVISALTLPESFVFTSSSSVKQNELIELELQDSRGSPLQNVEIIVLTPSNTAMRLTTDEKGKAKFKASEVGFYQYEVFGSKMDKRTEVLKVEVIDTSKKEDQNITVVNESDNAKSKDPITQTVEKSLEKVPPGIRQIVIGVGIVVIVLFILLITYSFFSRSRKREKLEEEDIEERIERESFVYSLQKDEQQKKEQSIYTQGIVSEQTKSLQKDQEQKIDETLLKKPTPIVSKELNKEIKVDYIKESVAQETSSVTKEETKQSEEEEIIKEIKDTVSSSAEEEDTETLEEKLKRIREIVKELHEESESIEDKSKKKKAQKKESTERDEKFSETKKTSTRKKQDKDKKK